MKNISRNRLLVASAATLLGLPAAQAQSSVNISGVVDIGVYRDNHTKVTNVGPISRSYLTFSGSEDLGGGMTALFTLTTRFEPDTGSLEQTNKPFFHGESTVGIKGGFGTLKLGRRLDAVNSLDWQFDPWYNFDRVASPAWDTWHYNFPSDPRANGTAAAPSADYGRLNNGIFYDSPNFNGFAAHFSGSPEKVPGDKNRAMAGALTYNGTNFSAMGAHSKNSAGNTDNFIGAKVSFSPVAVMAVYNVSKTDTSKAKTFTAGVEYNLGATTLKGGYGQVDVDGVKAVKIASAGAFYSLSKRTTVYGELAHRNTPADSYNTYGVGIAHSF